MQTPFIIGLFLLMALLHPMPAHSNDTLFTAIGARLGHMKAVAHYKFIQQRPIEDLAREAVVIKDAERAGHSLGLPADLPGGSLPPKLRPQKPSSNTGLSNGGPIRLRRIRPA